MALPDLTVKLKSIFAKYTAVKMEPLVYHQSVHFFAFVHSELQANFATQ